MTLLFGYQNTLAPIRGGVQKMCKTLATYFLENGHTVIYLTWERTEGTLLDPRLILLNLSGDRLFTAENSKIYEGILKEYGVDVVINHEGSNERAEFFMNVGAARAKVISVFHNDPLARFRSPFFRKSYFPKWMREIVKVERSRRALMRLLERSDVVVLLSTRFVEEVESKLKITSKKLVAIPNAIAPIELYRNDGRKLVLFVGRMEMKQKRPDLLLRIWSVLEPSNKDWELVFLGDGPYFLEAKELTKQLNLQNVHFIGFASPDEWFREAAILCMTSDYEGFGLVLIEAMQFGVVPMAFDNWPSLRDIIDDKVNGRVIDSGDLDRYKLALEELMHNEQLRMEMSMRAREKSFDFEISVIGPKWDKLLQSTLR